MNWKCIRYLTNWLTKLIELNNFWLLMLLLSILCLNIGRCSSSSPLGNQFTEIEVSYVFHVHHHTSYFVTFNGQRLSYFSDEGPDIHLCWIYNFINYKGKLFFISLLLFNESLKVSINCNWHHWHKFHLQVFTSRLHFFIEQSITFLN